MNKILKNKRLCFSNLDESEQTHLQKLIEEMGGKIDEELYKKTNYLVTNCNDTAKVEVLMLRSSKLQLLLLLLQSLYLRHEANLTFI